MEKKNEMVAENIAQNDDSFDYDAMHHDNADKHTCLSFANHFTCLHYRSAHTCPE